eukprot:Selendium_serpulae@DN2790_c0_g1_i1.p1
MATKHSGRCKWFDPKKGYGFISPEDGSPDVFVHQQNVYADGFRTLSENEQVEFEIITDETGRRKAVQVTGPNGAHVLGDRTGNAANRGGAYGGAVVGAYGAGATPGPYMMPGNYGGLPGAPQYMASPYPPQNPYGNFAAQGYGQTGYGAGFPNGGFG